MDGARLTIMEELYGSGASLTKIGATVGISRERVRQLLRRAGVPPRPRNYPQQYRHVERNRAIVAHLTATGDLEGVAREFDLSSDRVGRIVRGLSPVVLSRRPGKGWRVPRELLV